MKQFRIEADDEPTARTRLAQDLGIPEQDLRCIASKEKEFSFEAIKLPPQLELDISKDKMRARIKRIRMPVGEGAPKLTTDFVVEELKRKGVRHGIKLETITEELFRICSKENFDESRPLNIVVAEGEEPSSAQAGRPQWVVDLKMFKKQKPVFARRGEVVAKASIAIKGKEGLNIFGDKLDFQVEDPFRLPVGRGISVQQKGNEIQYVTEMCGQLFLDQGIRLRLETKILDIDEGLGAAIVLAEKSFSGGRFSGEEIREAAEKSGVSYGLLSPQEISQQMKAVKKWPAQIVMARGDAPVDGKPGKVELFYKTPQSSSLIDQERAKAAVVFPGEVIARIQNPSPPKDGQTVFGEKLRGRPYSELPIYPGKNIQKERDGETDIFRAKVYGKVRLEEERLHIENLLEVDKDATLAVLDLFPQQALNVDQALELLRDKDVLFGFDKEKLSLELQQVHKSGKRNRLVLAKAEPFISGRNAKIRYFFRPQEMKSKGLLIKSKPKPVFAAPGDLLMEKILPVEARDGTNLYREKIEAPKSVQAADVEIRTGKYVSEKEVGSEDDPNDPIRIQYRATSFGLVKWQNRELDVTPTIEIDQNEEYFKMKLVPRSDFGSLITYEMIESFAREEGIKVELEKSEIMKALRQSPPEGELNEVLIAKSVPARNGSDARIEYFVEFNGEPMGDWLHAHKPANPAPEICDCVRQREVLAIKTPAGQGVDGKTVFGRRIIAERGNDEPWLSGWGVERSQDGNSLVVSSGSMGFVMIEDRRIIVQNTVKISADKMQATMWIYPSRSARFQPREDKIMGMLQAKGVVAGIKVDQIRQGLADAINDQKAVEVVVAEGVPAGVGRSASYRLSFEADHAGLIREDGSIDYKAGSVFHMVREGQLLMVKQEATQGPDGFNVLDERIPGQFGRDQKMNAGAGVKVSSNGLEFHAAIDGILELSEHSIRVIEGLLIPGDVDYSTGSIDAGAAKVMIRGAVLPGFSVSSDSDIIIDQVAEACQLKSKADIKVNGGIIGKEKAHIRAEGKVEALYINSGATVEAKSDVITGNEILNSNVRAGGYLICDRGAGTISGGDIWAFDGIRAKVLGALGAETPTKIYLGVSYLEMQNALQRIEDEGLNAKDAELSEDLKKMDKELKELYEQIPEAEHSEAQALQARYKELYEYRRQAESDLATVKKQKDVILNKVARNKDFKVVVSDTIHPGVVLIYKDTEWEIKEPMKSVQISWNEAGSNFQIRRI